jgi:hypothetical protein
LGCYNSELRPVDTPAHPVIAESADRNIRQVTRIGE